MVRFNMRSLAFMAFAVFAAAAPVTESMNRQDVAAAPMIESMNRQDFAAAPVANVAPVQVAPHQYGQIERESVQPAPVAAHQNQGMVAPQKGQAQDPSQMVRMVPCSESECFNSLSPEDQVTFKRQCEQMRLEQMKNNAKGQNRVSKDGAAAAPQLTFYKMVPTQQAGANGSTAVGNRPNGKNLCCCCCPCCCCCCPCCCCCKCCCCKCCCCCCPCCCGCCC